VKSYREIEKNNKYRLFLLIREMISSFCFGLQPYPAFISFIAQRW